MLKVNISIISNISKVGLVYIYKIGVKDNVYLT
jgi:hypothetical protein